MFEKLNAILGLFTVEQPEWSAAGVAQALRMPRSTTYRLLARISAAGFLDVDDRSGHYRLGIQLASLGARAQRSTSLQRAAHEILQRITAESNETATLMVRAGWESVTIHVAESVRTLMVPGLLGGRHPLHASAGGKVLLAWMSDADRRTILRGTLAAHTPTTITDAAILEQELQRIRARGYSTVRGEWDDDVWGAAAPVRDYTLSVVGAIAMGGPRSRVTEARLPELIALVTSGAAQVSNAVGYVGAA